MVIVKIELSRLMNHVRYHINTSETKEMIFGSLSLNPSNFPTLSSSSGTVV